MCCSAWNAAGLPRQGILAWLLLFLSVPALCAQGASTNLSFAGGQIACEIISPGPSIPDRVLSTLPIAMTAALEHVGAPAEPVQLTLRLQETPSVYKRAKALFRVEALATQQGDEILLRTGEDPLKLAFRIAHELSHWLVSKRHPVRPPLWLDEGLAQRVGAAAADTCARTRKQTAERPRPPKLDRNLFAIDELTGLQAYPKSEARSAAFYWQAEALVDAIRRRLGSVEFTVYLGWLSTPGAPDWRTPLRERWYFSDWDFQWLAQQIQPKTESP
ncbi:MAG: hypothetical protein EOM72_07920 [Opitutae bacterium]|nr:hypothetical protein [Opitutae bacterium]